MKEENEMKVWWLSCDPGISASNASGFALWHGGELSHSFVVRPRAGTLESRIKEIRDVLRERISGIPLVEVVCELPKVYAFGRQKGDQNDLIHLTLVVGMLIGLFPGTNVQLYTPQDWKGTMDKDTITRRVLSTLTDAERARIEVIALGLRHNAIEAVGIGLKRLGRKAPNALRPLEEET